MSNHFFLHVVCSTFYPAGSSILNSACRKWSLLGPFKINVKLGISVIRGARTGESEYKSHVHDPGSKTDGAQMGFIWAGWGPYAPHGNHVGPIWAIRIVMHTRSTHMGPTWVSICVVLGNLNSNAYQINTYGPHMGPTCVVLGNLNRNAYQINTYGPHMGPICVVLGNLNSNAYQINTYGPHMGPICVVLGNLNSNAYQINT